MALFKPIKTTSIKMNDINIVEGQFIFLTDTNELYIDKSATERVKVSADLTQYLDGFSFSLGENNGMDVSYSGNGTIDSGDIQIPREDTMNRIAEALEFIKSKYDNDQWTTAEKQQIINVVLDGIPDGDLLRY